MINSIEFRDFLMDLYYWWSFASMLIMMLWWPIYSGLLESKYHPDPYSQKEIDKDSDEYKKKLDLCNKMINKRRKYFFWITITAMILFFSLQIYIPKFVDISQECTINTDWTWSCFFEKTEDGIASLCGYVWVNTDDWWWERILYHELDSQVAKSTQICTSGMGYIWTLKRDFFVSIPDRCISKWKFICKLSFVRTEDLFAEHNTDDWEPVMEYEETWY